MHALCGRQDARRYRPFRDAPVTDWLRYCRQINLNSLSELALVKI